MTAQDVYVTIFLHGVRGQEQSQELIRVDGDVAVLRDGLAEDGVAYYHLKHDGRRCDADGKLCPWDFWRLRVADVPPGLEGSP